MAATTVWENIEKKIVGHVGTNWNRIPIQYPNQSYDPTGQAAWIAMSIVATSARRLTMTGDNDTGILYEGQVIFRVHRLRNKGTGVLKTYVDDLADMLRYQRITVSGEKYIEFYVPKTESLGREGHWWVDGVMVPFEYLE